MTLALRRVGVRLLPNGPVDALRQLALLACAYYAYSLVRGAVWDRTVSAFDHASWVIGVERSLHVFNESAIQSWSSSQHWLIVAFDWVYLNAQFSIALAALIFIYVRHNSSFYFVRNMFMIAMLLALVLYAVYPTAPPRLLPEWGFHDTVAQLTGIPPEDPTVNAIFNPYAAVPSMHVAFAVMLGVTLTRLIRWRVARILTASYPVLICWVVIATGNHFWLDAIAGALVAATSAWGAHRLLARARPNAWAFARPAEATA